MPVDLTSIDHFLIDHKPVGSRVTCDPPPMDTDEDHLILIESEDLAAALDALADDGYVAHTPRGRYYHESSGRPSEFVSVRKGEINLLITSKDKFFRRFIAATSIAKRFNLMDKEDRVALFQAVLYGNPCGGA